MDRINLSSYTVKLINTETNENVNLDNIEYGTLYPSETPKSLKELLLTFFKEKHEGKYANDDNYTLNVTKMIIICFMENLTMALMEQNAQLKI